MTRGENSIIYFKSFTFAGPYSSIKEERMDHKFCTMTRIVIPSDAKSLPNQSDIAPQKMLQTVLLF